MISDFVYEVKRLYSTIERKLVCKSVMVLLYIRFSRTGSEF